MSYDPGAHADLHAGAGFSRPSRPAEPRPLRYGCPWYRSKLGATALAAAACWLPVLLLALWSHPLR